MNKLPLDYEEFKKELISLNVEVNPYLHFNIDEIFLYKNEGKRDSWWRIHDKEPTHDYLLWSAETGGSEGGSCWGGESEEYIVEVENEEFEDLEKILEVYCGDMTYKSVSRLCDAITGITKEDNETDYEYYGNYTTYRYKLILLKDLHKLLVSYIYPSK